MISSDQAPPGARYQSTGVEFVCPSVTSDGFYEIFRGRLPGASPETIVQIVNFSAGQVRTANPWVKFLDGIGHGYTIVDVTPERVQGDWFLTPTPTTAQPDPRIVPSVVPVYKASYRTMRNSKTVVAAPHQVGGRGAAPANSSPAAGAA